jgi:hypothetical protein
MRSYTVPAVAVLAVFALAGCSDQADQQQPTAPELHTVTSSTTTCDFTHVRQLANSYFSTPVQQQVKTLLDAMSSATAYSSTAKLRGFDILKKMDEAVNGTNPTTASPSSGSDLVNELILCMYNPSTEAASYPETFPESFVIALTPSAKGAFSVRGTLVDAAPVLSRPTDNPFSGIGVSSGDWTITLTNTTNGNGEVPRVLFYGKPGSTSSTYDWKTLPRDVKFTPDIIVGVCTTSGSALINEDQERLLAYQDAYFLDPPDNCSSTSAMLLNEPIDFAKRLIQQGLTVFSPQPLMAAAFNPGGVGGRTSGIGSEYGPSQIDSVKLTFDQQPTSTKVNTSITPAVKVKAIAYPSLKPVPNATISVKAVNNNGATVTLTGTTQVDVKTVAQETDATGTATFSDLKLSKSGSYQLLATGLISGRTLKFVTATSTKFNIAPK